MSPDAMALSRLRELALLKVDGTDILPLLRPLLDAAMAFVEADFGNIQLVDASTGRLVIAVHQGFAQEWIDFWNRAAQEHGSCGAALAAQARVLVEDVERSPLFVGTPALDVQLKAGVRAVQSTPLVTRTGEAVGVLSTHFKRPRRLPADKLPWLDLLARQAADMIEASRAAAQRDAERMRLAALLQALPVGVAFAHSRDCERVEGNAAFRAMFGVDVQENASATAASAGAFGRQITYRQDGQPIAAEDLPLQRVAREEVKVGPLELEITSPGAEPMVVEVTAAPILGADGKGAGAVAVLVDVMARRRAEEALEQVRHKDEFLAVLGHELRNPLAAVHGVVNGWTSGESPEKSAADRKLIDQQVDVLMRLADDLSDASRAANGQLRLQVGPVSLAELLDAGAATLAPALRQRQQQLVLARPDPDVVCQGDQVRLLQIVANLIDNASRYTGTGGRIELSCGLDGGDVVLRCRDNGQGIAPQLLQRIFEPLVRAPAASIAAPAGLGLGLALVRRLAQLHGGDVTAFSDGEGLGSEFVVRFPHVPTARPAPLPVGECGGSPGIPAGSAAGLRVLLVEDHPDLAAATRDLLLREGLVVTSAATGSQALAVAMESQPQLLLCDMHLPDMSGLQLIDRLRPQLAAWGTHVVVITGQSANQLGAFARHAGELGVDEFIPKPLTADWLGSLRHRPGGH
ncbi:MAG TPA: ATP-binding protein [Roseateles sp.]